MSATPEGDDLPVLLAQARALHSYAEAHGSCWKQRLLAEWMNATAEPLLHHLRNTHGPGWLLRYRLDGHRPNQKSSLPPGG